MKPNALWIAAPMIAGLAVTHALADEYGYEYAAQLKAPTVPAELKLPEGYKLARVVGADGVQIYACQAKADKSGFEWAFKAPEAVLTDDKGNKVGTHGAGPFWEANDGSRVVGEVKARVNSSDASAIPWLLLATKSTGKAGAFAKTAFIHRLETVGGKAPATGCDANSVGKETREGYTAKYYLYEEAAY